MNHNNWYKEDVVTETIAKELLHLFSGMINNLGHQVKYYKFVNNTYAQPVLMRAYLQSNTQNEVGGLEFKDRSKFLISAKDFIESGLVPTTRDKVEWNEETYRITSVTLASKDSMKVITNNLDNAFLVVLNVVSDTINRVVSRVS